MLPVIEAACAKAVRVASRVGCSHSLAAGVARYYWSLSWSQELVVKAGRVGRSHSPAVGVSRVCRLREMAARVGRGCCPRLLAARPTPRAGHTRWPLKLPTPAGCKDLLVALATGHLWPHASGHAWSVAVWVVGFGRLDGIVVCPRYTPTCWWWDPRLST
ncbi:hypothetical protein Dimus_032486 [Dionaea muscipula]